MYIFVLSSLLAEREREREREREKLADLHILNVWYLIVSIPDLCILTYLSCLHEHVLICLSMYIFLCLSCCHSLVRMVCTCSISFLFFCYFGVCILRYQKPTVTEVYIGLETVCQCLDNYGELHADFSRTSLKNII